MIDVDEAEPNLNLSRILRDRAFQNRGKTMSRPLASSLIRSLRSLRPTHPSLSSSFANPKIALRKPHRATFRFNSNSAASSSTPHASSSSPPSFTSNLLRPTTLVLILVPILTGFLGVWQIKRLKWKVALIEEVDRNLMREPMVLPGIIK